MRSRSLRNTNRAGRGHESGATLVEAAIVFLPLCMILFGFIEYGFIFKDSLTLSSASRSGARVASAIATQPSMLDQTVAATAKAGTAAQFKIGLDQIWVYKAATDGSPADGCPSATCVVYTYQGGTGGVQNTGFTKTAGSWDPTNQKACLSAARDSVGVRVTVHHDAISGFFQNMLLSERTVMQFEPLQNDCT